jgi:beta-xylosidase
MFVAHSQDLINWSQQLFVPVMRHQPTARNCWAPEITWDSLERQYVIYWATTIPEKFQETAKFGDDGWNHRMYCTTTKDFQTYTPTRLFYENGFNVIDATITHGPKDYVMILKDETRHPPAKNLRVARGDGVTGPFTAASQPFTPDGIWVEGPSVLRIGGYWIVYYDEYRRGRYGAMRTRDFNTWEEISEDIDFPAGTRHGTAFPVSPRILEPLLQLK